MLAIPLLLAAGSLFTLSSGAPLPHTLSTRSLVGRSDAYISYGGNGQVSVGWPSKNDWVADFETMFNNNKAIMKSGCAAWGVPNNSDDEIQNIHDAINAQASSTGIDARFILAIVMQESNGCVRVPTTNWGVRNPGLMQDHDGSHTCNEGGVQNPCPKDQITGMITDGVSGTTAGDGLKQCLTQAGGMSDVSSFYKAARIYNSGSIASGGNLGMGVATHCYASDVANRLTGWVNAAKTCEEGSIGSMTAAAGSVANGGNDNTGNSPTTTATPTPTSVAVAATSAPASTVAPAQTSAPAPTQTASNNTPTTSGNAPTAEKAPGAASNCTKWYTIQSGDYCEKVEQANGLSSGSLQKFNSQLDAACSNLWLGYAYCVAT